MRKRRRTGATFTPTPRKHLEPIDFGPGATPKMVTLIEKFRETVTPERRLLMIKFFARSVAVDGNDQERPVGNLIDATATCYFRARYPGAEMADPESR